MIDLHVDSIFEIAQQMERDGTEFYRKAAESADENRRAVLLALAEMELNHERTFTAMRSEMSDGKFETLVPPKNSQSALYLQAVLNGGIFGSDRAPKLTGQESIDRVFEIAISLEKDAIIFYQSMKTLVPPGQAREQIDQIIDQEIGHILELTRE
jgi:rubrerythrin